MDVFKVLDTAAAEVAAKLSGFNAEEWTVTVQLRSTRTDHVLERSSRMVFTK